MSSPEIAIQQNKSYVSRTIKRTQKDYTKSFKLQNVQEIEHGELSKIKAI